MRAPNGEAASIAMSADTRDDVMNIELTRVTPESYARARLYRGSASRKLYIKGDDVRMRKFEMTREMGKRPHQGCREDATR